MPSKLSSNKILAILTTISVFFTSCVKEIDEYQAPNNSNTIVSNINDLQIPGNFNFTTDRICQINLELKGNDNLPLPFVKVRILDNSLENNGKTIFTGISDQNGVVTGSARIAKNISQVSVCCDYIGLPNNIVTNLSGNSISLSLGGKNPLKLHNSIPPSKITSSINNRNASTPNKVYIGSWDNEGVPSYLDNQRDIISSDMLSRINSSLPEYQSVPLNHSNYLASNTNNSALITQQADVWMTFIHEGAGNRNSIGYYAYNKNNPPQSVGDITNIKIVFPNFSYRNSGGGMVSGDKVYLGSFGPDTIIGFVLLSNAFDITSSSVGNGSNQFYSISGLNPETNPSLQKHNVALWDYPTQKLIIGFEDLNRNGGDNDFNDAIFSVSTYPSTALSTTSTLNTSSAIDTDGDGVNNNIDDYPNDPNLAFNTYYPSSSTFGHIAFEDLWPFKGDYDMNDLIVGYKYILVKNASSEVVSIQTSVYVKAAGGSYQNGFGIELPISPSDVSMVIGENLQEGYINLNSNATEAGQNKAVIIPFDNATNLAPRPVGYYINTQQGSPVVISDTIKVSVWLTHPIPSSVIGDAPFNPFLICNKNRGHEIHLANNPPTTLADQSLFNTGNDRTNIALGRYYLSDKNIPWALNIPGEYPIVLEKSEIIDAYLKFQPWCQSGGTQYNDWYQDLPGYRNNSQLLFR
ncbi:MAG TPA: LruC domain-containing protein [Bacteroidia bacterium]|nr:LruC domain-containing protein [Bacteroidia bacterium]